ncbi:MAG: PHP domain-containing protein, partial [Clostridia bacterium]|nr:PHP domain-containing protein [Clostridia bacterium]
MNQVFNREPYDIFPLVFPMQQGVTFTVTAPSARKPLSGVYAVTVHNANAGATWEEFSAWNTTEFTCEVGADGALRFTYTAQKEGEYFVRLSQDGKQIAQLYVYALAEDLSGRYPLRGDFHLHTSGSDGQQSPAVVCANYRKRGYDFIVITDHDRYYPSLDAITAYMGVDIPLSILPGEEVHLPGTTVHIVNAGGLFSINGLLPMKENYLDTNGELSRRRFDESVQPPDVYTMPDFWRDIEEIERGLTADGTFPKTVDSRSYAVCLWIFDKIHEAQGLGIFCHPNWINDLYQITEDFTLYMLEHHPFDAFEVLGGENYYHQNGLQTAMYYEEYKHGRVHPIVGSTDSHNSMSCNRNYDLCSTIVFAKSDGREDILNAVREKYSLAVDTLSKEYRLVGEYRLQKY